MFVFALLAIGLSQIQPAQAPAQTAQAASSDELGQYGGKVGRPQQDEHDQTYLNVRVPAEAIGTYKNILKAKIKIRNRPIFF